MPRQAPKHWHGRSLVALALLPLSALFGGLAALRRGLYRSGLLRSIRLSVPVIVVGNIAVGGSGKTPVVQWTVALLRAAGYRPGVVSRGYGGTLEGEALVGPDSDPAVVGDEPLLLSRSCGCPVAVGRDRPAAANLLIASGCTVVVADDGLQHYRLVRDVEIVVLDSVTLGNRYLLPAGPLREPLSRLASADLVLAHGSLDDVLRRSASAVPVVDMWLGGELLHALDDKDRTCPLDDLNGKTVHAFAGIGRPERFFATLRAAGLRVIEHAFPDHHVYSRSDFDDVVDATKLLTAKDAVKCESFGLVDAWVLPVSANIERTAAERILEKLKHGCAAA